MTTYELLLFAHIALVTVWLGGSVMMQFFAWRALRSGAPARMAELTKDIEWIGNRLMIPASLGVLLFGVLLVLEGPWSFGDDWIVIALALFAVTFLGGALFFGPESGRIGKAIDAGGPESPEAQRRIRRLLALSRADAVVLYLIAYDMVVKPEFGDVGAIAVGLVTGVALAALLVWHGLSATAPRSAAA